MPSTDMLTLKKYALITGATSGFGYEFAKIFAANGYHLVLVARSAERLNEVSDELVRDFGIGVTPLAKDLFNPVSALEVYQATRELNIRIDVLINDAGQGEHGKFTDYSLSRDIDIIQLNVTSLVSLTKYFLKDMVARGDGKVLQVSSLLAKYPTPLMSVYAATKAFVLSFTEGLIGELKDTNVTMTALLPGASDTDFFHKAGASDTVIYRETELSAPEDVAREGYEALMRGESKIIFGFKNKLQAAASAILPDNILASSMRNQMSQSTAIDGREGITHLPSRQERGRIQHDAGKDEGDYERHEGHIHSAE